MTSELSIFAARLREFITIYSEETSSIEAPDNPALQAHYDAEFSGLAIMLFTLQFKFNGAYRKFCEAQGISPGSISHWTQIPAVPAAAFKELELTSLASSARTTVFHSSGTTEQRPGRHFHSAESLALYEASLWPWFQTHVIPDWEPNNSGLSLLILAPPPAQAPHSSLVHMLEVVRVKLGAPAAAFRSGLSQDGSWELCIDSALAQLQEAQVSEPVILIGTAFSFVHLLDNLAARRVDLRLPIGSRVMETGGYKGRSRSLPKPELHALITERLGIPPEQIVCEYGMSELSSQAYDRRVSSPPTRASERTFRFPPWTRAQVICPETNREAGLGETGLIRIFDPANAFSVMAIQTEDLAVRRTNGFELIGRAAQSEPRGCSLMNLEQ